MAATADVVVTGGWRSQLDSSAFADPPARARMAPFWFVNTDLSVDHARAQVQAMVEGGCGGFFIHARQGLQVPYLSDSWFELVRAAVEKAAECGLEAWLYDEYPYPSGIAGGLVTANRPVTRARVLERVEMSLPGGESASVDLPMGRLVSALAVPVVDDALQYDEAVDIRRHVGVVLGDEHYLRWPMPHIPYNSRRYTADGGRLVLRWTPPSGSWRLLAGVEIDQRGFKYYDCFVDPLVPGAVEEFLTVTHERYAQEVGEFFGNVIPGIFSDEIEAPSWSPELASAMARDGVDLAVELPALFDDTHPHAGAVRRAWNDLRVTLFAERWERPMRAWCAAHGLIWVAEKPVERPSQFWEVAQPATDAGHRRVELGPEPLPIALRANNRAAMAAAEQLGGEEVRCENFHSLGWGATLADQKWATDWLVVHGVNRFTPHAFYATSSGLRKHDAAPSFFVQTPAWQYFRALADYTGRLCLAASAGREAARIAVLHPTGALSAGGAMAAAAADSLTGLMNQLLDDHQMFHPVDARAVLTAVPTEDGALELGHARYETLVVAWPSDDDETRAAITAAGPAGLRVLSAGSSSGEVVAALADDRLVSVRKAGSPDEISDVWCLVRETGEQLIVVLANTSGSAQEIDVSVKAQLPQWERWDCETGTIAAMPGIGRISLPAWGSTLLVGRKTSSAAAVPAAEDAPTDYVSLEGTWERTLDRPNALRLNRWQARFGAVRPDYDAWTLVEAVPLRYRDTENDVWVEQISLPDTPDDLWYRRLFDVNEVPADAMLRIEDGAVDGDFMLSVNGRPVDLSTAVAESGPTGTLPDVRLVPIGGLLTIGSNVLTLHLSAKAGRQPMLCTPLHLVGSFGLSGVSDARVLERPMLLGEFGSRTGVEHFAGTITYRRRQQVGGQTLELPDSMGDPVRVRFNGEDLGVRCWPPYRWNLPAGNGDLSIEVTTTMLPFYEGQQWKDGAASSV